MGGELEGRRVLVVGASRGIGYAAAVACGDAGARLAVAARTTSQLQAHADRHGAAVVDCDVCDEAGCRAAVDSAVSALGGLDALVITTGITSFGDVAEYSRSRLEDVFATNVFGPHSVLAAAVPHLEQSGGHAVVLNSESAQYVPDPWPGIGAYIASKRALDSLVRSYHVEHPAVAFTSYFVGATLTNISSEGAEPYLGRWLEKGYLEVTNALVPEDHGRIIVDILTAGERVRIDAVGVRPRHISGGIVEF